jgi:hypothetical protein
VGRQGGLAGDQRVANELVRAEERLRFAEVVSELVCVLPRARAVEGFEALRDSRMQLEAPCQ